MIYTSHFASHKHCGRTIMHIIIPALGVLTQWIDSMQCESTHGMLQHGSHHGTRPTPDRTACARGEREKMGPACLRNARTEERTILAECGESATGPGCPEYGRREIFSLGQRAVEYNVRRRLHRREQNQATEEGRQADPVSRSQSAQKRQHKRIEGDYSAYCLMHASLKQPLHGASSGSPDNALHSLVYYTLLPSE